MSTSCCCDVYFVLLRCLLQCEHWQSDRFSQPITGLAEQIDDRLHNRFMGHHVENFRKWTVGRGSDASHDSRGMIIVLPHVKTNDMSPIPISQYGQLKSLLPTLACHLSFSH